MDNAAQVEVDFDWNCEFNWSLAASPPPPLPQLFFVLPINAVCWLGDVVILPFKPYSISQIVAILEARVGDAIPKAALELCARRVSGMGDLRVALDICRYISSITQLYLRSLDDVRRVVDISNESTDPPMLQMLKVTQSVFGSANPNIATIQNMNIQCKFILVIAFLAREHSLTRLHELYTRYCRHENTVTPVARSEFLDLIGIMESVGVLSMNRKKQATAFVLAVNEDEIRDGVKSSTLLSQMILHGLSESFLETIRKD